MSIPRPLLLVSATDVRLARAGDPQDSPIHRSLERFFGVLVLINDGVVQTGKYGDWTLSLVAQQRLCCWWNKREMDPCCITLYATDSSKLPDNWHERQALT